MEGTVTEMIVNGIKYKPVEPPAEQTADIRICILERGWVVVGNYQREGDQCKVTNGAVIRVWGTTKGLPELVAGPTKNTVLDKCETPIEFNIGAQIATLACNADGWKGKL